MLEIRPNVVTSNSNQKLTHAARRAHQESLARRLSQAYLGRENHAASFSLAAVVDPACGDTLLQWTDEFTAESGWLGRLRPKETRPIVLALFAQLRAWRQRCDNYGVAKAAAAGGGAR